MDIHYSYDCQLHTYSRFSNLMRRIICLNKINQCCSVIYYTGCFSARDQRHITQIKKHVKIT